MRLTMHHRLALCSHGNFIVIKSPEIKNKIHQSFTLAHQEAQAMFEAEKQDKYKNLKLEGIIESPINICITCDRNRTGKNSHW